MNWKRVGLVIVFAAVVLAAVRIYSAFRAPAEASGPLEAIPLEVEGGQTTGEGDAATPDMPDESVAAAEPVTSPEVDEAAPISVEVGEATVSPVAAATPAAEASEAETAGAEASIFEINPSSSVVRFELDEDLRGSRVTVVGSTDQVAGQLAVDLNDLSSVQVGTLQINARALATDNNFRNRAIHNEILDTGSFEFITFTPANVTGLPASTAVGESVEFVIEGDLTIRDITLPVSFAVTATAVTDTQIEGTAATTIQRNDYDLVIPSVPNVANVEEEVELYIDFVANRS